MVGIQVPIVCNLVARESTWLLRAAAPEESAIEFLDKFTDPRLTDSVARDGKNDDQGSVVDVLLTPDRNESPVPRPCVRSIWKLSRFQSKTFSLGTWLSRDTWPETEARFDEEFPVMNGCIVLVDLRTTSVLMECWATNLTLCFVFVNNNPLILI